MIFRSTCHGLDINISTLLTNAYIHYEIAMFESTNQMSAVSEVWLTRISFYKNDISITVYASRKRHLMYIEFIVVTSRLHRYTSCFLRKKIHVSIAGMYF